MKDLTDGTVKNMHLDIAKVIAEYSGLNTDEVGVLFVRCGGKWDFTINVIYIMMKRKVGFKQAVSLYKQYLSTQIKKKPGGN